MRKLVALAATPVVAASAVVAMQTAAHASFGNCTNMHRVYPHGVAASRRAARREHRKTGYPLAAVRPKVYWANSNLDADHDHVACEA